MYYYIRNSRAEHTEDYQERNTVNIMFNMYFSLTAFDDLYFVTYYRYWWMRRKWFLCWWWLYEHSWISFMQVSGRLQTVRQWSFLWWLELLLFSLSLFLLLLTYSRWKIMESWKSTYRWTQKFSWVYNVFISSLK